MLSEDHLRTGDILLFNEHPNNILFSFIDSCIRCATNSPYSHAGIVIVDPEWAPKGTYVWDSSYHVHPDPQDQKIKFGIALVKLEDYLDNIDGKQQLYRRSPVTPKPTIYLRPKNSNVCTTRYMENIMIRPLVTGLPGLYTRLSRGPQKHFFVRHSSAIHWHEWVSCTKKQTGPSSRRVCCPRTAENCRGCTNTGPTCRIHNVYSKQDY